LGVRTIGDVILRKYAPKPPNSGRMDRQFQAKMPNISKTANPVKPKFMDKTETTNCTSWVVYYYPKPNPTWLTADIMKITMTS